MGMSDLCHLPAHQLVRMMSCGGVSCEEVVRVAVTGHLEKVFGGWRPPPLAVNGA
jgi:hypothetical protein